MYTSLVSPHLSSVPQTRPVSITASCHVRQPYIATSYHPLGSIGLLVSGRSESSFSLCVWLVRATIPGRACHLESAIWETASLPFWAFALLLSFRAKVSTHDLSIVALNVYQTEPGSLHEAQQSKRGTGSNTSFARKISSHCPLVLSQILLSTLMSQKPLPAFCASVLRVLRVHSRPQIQLHRAWQNGTIPANRLHNCRALIISDGTHTHVAKQTSTHMHKWARMHGNLCAGKDTYHSSGSRSGSRRSNKPRRALA